MDRNQVIGLSLLVVLLTVYMYFNTSQQKKLEAEKNARIEAQRDSLAQLDTLHNDLSDTALAVQSSIDTQSGSVINDTSASAQIVSIANDNLQIDFNTKGASPIKANLLKYKTFYGDSLILFDGPQNHLSFLLPLANKTVSTQDVIFTPSIRENSIVFTASAEGTPVQISYSLRPDQYLMDMELRIDGQLVNKPIYADWQNTILPSEQDLKNERNTSHFYYREKESKDVDYYTMKEEVEEEYDEVMDWISIKPAFFNNTLIAEQGIKELKAKSNYKKEDSSLVAQTSIEFALAQTPDNVYKMQMLIGPNSYDSLKTYQLGLEKIIPMGRGIFEFVKYINRGLILPVFEFLSKFIRNYGVIIMILTLFIRLLLSFFTYRSYLSQAKMQALKPELDELKEKHKGDQQKLSAEQMKLYQQAGVNPLGGCLPSLLQLPFLIAMYSFFPSALELRQKAFLWCKDLSSYDSILSWDAHIPLLSTFYGNHISLFTVLLTVSSLLLAIYSSSMTADNNNPALKYLPYVMPVMFLGFFNNMAAGLTFYYFFSNLISLTQQYVIKNYVINPDKIRAQIEENKSKPKAKSGFAERLAQMQEQNTERKKKMEQMRQQQKKK